MGKFDEQLWATWVSVINILISPALLGRLTSVDADVSALSSIGNDPNTRRDVPASDHAPLIARFN